MMLSISLGTDDGRTIPIVWDGYAKGELAECESQNKIEERLMTKVLMSLPRKMKVLVLGDRGFHRPEFLKFLGSFGKNIDYIVRIPTGDFIIARGKEIELTGELIAKGTSKNFGTVEYTKVRRLPARCVAVWDENSREAWILLTNIKNTSSRGIAALYARRMSIEAMFKSMKNEVSGFSLKHARLRHIQRWLVLCFLATLLLQYFWEITQALTRDDRERLDGMFTLARHRRRYGHRRRSYSMYYLLLLTSSREDVGISLHHGRIFAWLN
jgi:hypothetical protein